MRAHIGAVLASLALAGCSDLSLGNRPLVYKHAPPDQVVIEAGIPRKVEPGAPAATAEPPAQAPSRSPANVAQARPPAPKPLSQTELQSRYTQAARYGDLLFLSGQIANDPRTGAFDPSLDVAAQTRRALENVRAILEANGLTMANIVSTSVYITNVSQLPDVDAAYEEFFRATPPARTVVEVSNLPRGAKVEITVVAGR